MNPKALLVATEASTVRSFLLPIGRHFREKGWTVDVAARGALACQECVASFDVAHDMSWHRRPARFENFRSIQEVRRLVSREGYDLVHVHTPTAGFVVRLALRKRGALPVVLYTAHGFHFLPGRKGLRNSLYRSLEGWSAKWTNAIVTINREDWAAAKRFRGTPDVVHMPGIGVDLQRFSRTSSLMNEARSVKTRFSPSAQIVCVVAEFISRKRHEDVLAALSMIGEADVHLLLLGEGPLKSRMIELARKSGLSERVHFLGYQSDVRPYVLASEVSVLASAQEGLPMSVMESMCLGVPVIGTRIRGIIELLEGGAGLLVDVNRPDQLAEAIQTILSSSSLRAAVTKTAEARVKRYELGAVIAAHEKLYEEVLNLRQ